MAIKRPDIYEHNNPNNAIVDSEFVKGGGKSVATITDLYNLSVKTDQLTERVTKVWVASASNYYILIDKNNIGNSTGWKLDEPDYKAIAANISYTHNQGVAASVWVITHNLNKKPSVIVVDSAGNTCIGIIEFNSNSQITITFSSEFSGIAYLN